MSAQFQGDTFDPVLDGPRLTRQLDRVKTLMNDGRWRTLAAIHRLVGGSEAGVSARLRDMRKSAHGNCLIERKRVKDSGLFMYRWNRMPTQIELWTAK
jgi:hypothetical protein